MRDEAGFCAFVERDGASLLHTARLLANDHHRGEDLVQTVLIKMYLRWDRIDTPLAYARTALVSAHIDQTRRRWWSERPAAELPDAAEPRADAGAADSRDELRRLLAGLGARDRAVVVMRYYCDLSEQETAVALGLPVGTVKSCCSRALSRLRVTAGTPT